MLTSGQKKIRFRNLFKKRKSETQNANTNHQDSAADDNDNANSNDSVPNQSRDGPPQDVVPKRRFRYFSDDTLGSQDKTQTIPRTRISNDQPIQSTAIAEGKKAIFSIRLLHTHETFQNSQPAIFSHTLIVYRRCFWN